MINFDNYISELNTQTKRTTASNKQGKDLETGQALEIFVNFSIQAKASGNSLYFIGNGASAAMSSHMSADAEKNGGFSAHSFSDISLITAVSNDISFDQVYALPIKRCARKDDILIAISSSGNSPNIVNAINLAREMGLKIVTITGMSEDNTCKQLGDLNFHTPAKTYGMVECAHQTILHCWLDRVVEKLEQK